MAARGRGSRKDERPAGLRAATVGPPPFPSAAPEVAWQLWWRAVRTEAMGQSGSPGRTIAATGTARSLPFPPGSGDLRPAGPWDSQGFPLPRTRRSQHATAASELLEPSAPAVSLGNPREAGDSRHRVQASMGVRRDTGSGGSSVHTPSQASVPAQRTDGGSRSSVQPRRPAEDPGCSLSHPAASTSGRLP